MTAPVIDSPIETTDEPAAERPEGTAPIKLVLAVEGIETSDGRYIEPGALSTRPLPLTLYAQVRSTHGADGDAATFTVGSLTEAERVPGETIVQRSTGQPFPVGTYAWVGKGWMYTDVPTPESGSKPAYTLLKDRALYGNSVDLTEVTAEFEYQDDISDGPPDRIVMTNGKIGSTTLVGIPAFMDAFAEVDGQLIEAPADAVALVAATTTAAGTLGRVFLSFRSTELGDECAPCVALNETVVPWLDDFAVSTEKRKKATEAGHALPDGSYPIETTDDLDKAISAVGRAGGKAGTEADRNKVRRHIIKQAKRLGAQDKIPDTWNSDGTLKTGSAAADTVTLQDLLTGEDIDPAALDTRTSGMVALIPADPARLAVPSGDPPGDLHLTLAYLGENVTDWSPEEIAAIHKIARQATDPAYWCQTQAELAIEHGEDPPNCDQLYTPPWHEGPLRGNVFAHAVFNPNGGPDGQEPATVYLFDGADDALNFANLAGDICRAIEDQLGELRFPQQHHPFVPHVTAGYNLDPNQLTYTGPVTFPRLRVAIGNQRTDYPLGGGAAVVASAAPLPSIDVFSDPQLIEPTPHTVTDDGRVYGHLAAWNTCHTGFPGQCVTPPESPSNYAYFLLHSTRAVDHDGNTVTVPVGYGTLTRSADDDGHASIRLSATEAVRHYDNTGTAVMEFTVGEDAHGVWYSGRLLPGLSEREEHLARGATFSGDWRTIRGRLELVAALGVNAPGYPVPRVRVASGVPVALVAAAVPHREHPEVRAAAAELGDEYQEVLDWVRAQKLTAQQADTAAGLAAIFEDLDTRELAADALTQQETDLMLVLDGDHPWFAGGMIEALDEAEAALLAAGGKLHLPPYIKRIAKHLQGEAGMKESRAIATAVNAAKKMCATGDLNFPGSQNVNPGSRAQACAAVAQWKADRPGAR